MDQTTKDMVRRGRHTDECPARYREYDETDCTCGVSLTFSSMGSSVSRPEGSERRYHVFADATYGVVLALKDGRVVTIADLGTGPVIRVQGPNDELLADYVLPKSAQVIPAMDAGEQYRVEGR